MDIKIRANFYAVKISRPQNLGSAKMMPQITETTLTNLKILIIIIIFRIFKVSKIIGEIIRRVFYKIKDKIRL